MQFARGCVPYIALPFTLTILSLGMGILLDVMPVHLLTSLLFVVSFGMLIFFRDPELPIGEGIVSPANGKVSGLDRTDDGKVILRIFMNVHNIHVNRCPMDGTVVKIEHIPGGHIPAFDKDAETNERVITDLRPDSGIGPVRIVQIAGSVARRIVPYISDGQKLARGERIGIIRLGSRVDLHLPADRVEMKVGVGDVVRPGQTVAMIVDVTESEAVPGKKVGSEAENRAPGSETGLKIGSEAGTGTYHGTYQDQNSTGNSEAGEVGQEGQEV